MTLKIGDIVKRPDGKRYILIADQSYMGEMRAVGRDRHPDHAGYMTVGDAKMENLEKVGESS